MTLHRHPSDKSPEGFIRMNETSEINARINLLLAMASLADAELVRKNTQIVKNDDDILRMTQESTLKDNYIARLKEENSQQHQQVRVLVHQVADQERRAAELLAVRDAMLSSTSWRMTAIIRWLGRLVRKPA